MDGQRARLAFDPRARELSQEIQEPILDFVGRYERLEAAVTHRRRFRHDRRSGALDIEATPPRAPAHEVHGTAAVPTAAAVPFVARWWFDGPHGTVLMRTDFPAIQFGASTMTLTTPAGSDLADLIGDTSLTFAILDSHNTFALAAMEVTVD